MEAEGGPANGAPDMEVCIAYVHPAGTDATDRTTRLVRTSSGDSITTGSTCFSTAGRATSAGAGGWKPGRHRILLRDGNTHARDRLGHEVRGCVSRFAPPADTERASVLLIVALSMVAILMIAVIDLGYTRSDRNATALPLMQPPPAGLSPSTTAAHGSEACEDALFYAPQEPRRERASSAQITSAQRHGGTVRRWYVALVTVDDTVVEVVSPRARRRRAHAGDRPRARRATGDRRRHRRGPCDRLAVSINRPQAHIFGGVAGGQDRRYSVHSVARFGASLGPNSVRPALVALNRTRCSAIDAGSNGTSCWSPTPRAQASRSATPTGRPVPARVPARSWPAGASARLIADRRAPPSVSSAGSAPPSRATTTGAGELRGSCHVPGGQRHYVGQLTARSRGSRMFPADRCGTCQNVPLSVAPASCERRSDPDSSRLRRGACPRRASPRTPAPATRRGRTLQRQGVVKNCPVFTVKGGTLPIAAGSTVIFNAMSVEAEASS